MFGKAPYADLKLTAKVLFWIGEIVIALLTVHLFRTFEPEGFGIIVVLLVAAAAVAVHAAVSNALYAFAEGLEDLRHMSKNVFEITKNLEEKYDFKP